MRELNGRSRLLIGVTLFSMFFGAGNLIFPPFLGYQAGSAVLPAFFGFVLTAVVCPVLGVAAVAKMGGLDGLCARINPKLGFIFAVIVYLCIGPMLAIPRTAGTSYAMFSFLTNRLHSVLWFGVSAELIVRTLFSVLFFLGAGYFAKHPERLRVLFGKRMTPVLLVLIVVLFVAGLAHGELPPAETQAAYANGALMKGFVDGYQTMDTMAALVFGIVIAVNLQDMGVTDKGQIAKETILGGTVAGVFLIVIYGMLSFLGYRSGSLAAQAANGTDILTAAAAFFFGGAGSVLLAVIYFIACFNVCVGLISSCSEFFSLHFPKLGYDGWRWLLTIWSFGISIVGLDQILAISAPILSLFYPLAIAIILLNILPFGFLRKPLVQRVVAAAALLAGVLSILP